MALGNDLAALALRPPLSNPEPPAIDPFLTPFGLERRSLLLSSFFFSFSFSFFFFFNPGTLETASNPLVFRHCVCGVLWCKKRAKTVSYLAYASKNAAVCEEALHRKTCDVALVAQVKVVVYLENRENVVVSGSEKLRKLKTVLSVKLKVVVCRRSSKKFVLQFWCLV